MAKPRSPVMWAALAGVALVLIGSFALLLIGRRAPSVPSANLRIAPCPALAQPIPAPESSPVILWAVGPVRLYVDGVAAFSPPEAPRRFAIGVHTLRAEAKGEEPLQTRFRVEPFTPALLHAQVVPGLGLTLVRIGAGCASCAFAESPPRLDPEPPRFPVPALLARAAGLLRIDQYASAADALAQVPPAQRHTLAFARLASAVYADGSQPDAARKLAQAAPPAEVKELEALLKALDALTAKEQARKAQAVVDRWNQATERFALLVSRYQAQAPAPTAAAARRMEQLSQAFDEASRHKDGAAQLQAAQAVETVLSALQSELAASRPGDCAFQAQLAAP